MSIIKNTVFGVFSGASKLLKGVGKGLEEGFEELSHIPANIRLSKMDKLSGRYTVDIGDGETATIKFEGGLFSWGVEEFTYILIHFS